MDCLSNYIGLRGCSQEQPVSGLWVDDLPGVSKKTMDAIAKDTERTYVGVWESLQRLAAQQLEIDVLERLGRDFRTKILQSVNAQRRFTQPFVPIAAVPDTFQGVRIQFKQSPYAVLTINAIKVYSGETVTVEDVVFNVYDLSDGSILYTKTVDILPGANVISVEWVIEPRLNYEYVFIGYESKFATVRTSNSSGGCCDVWECCCDYVNIGGAFVEIADPVILENLEKGSNTFGMGLDYNVSCSIMRFICQNRDQFKNAFYRLLGVKFMEMRLQSERVNATTEMNTDRNYTWLNENKKEYKRALDILFDMIGNNMPCDCCFELNPIVQQSWAV